MQRRNIELLTIILLFPVTYFGNSFLNESANGGPVSGLLPHLLNYGFMVSVAVIGYIGLYKHEAKWIKAIWVGLYSLMFVLLLFNKITRDLFNHPFLIQAMPSVMLTPFTLMLAVFVPRWLNTMGD